MQAKFGRCLLEGQAGSEAFSDPLDSKQFVAGEEEHSLPSKIERDISISARARHCGNPALQSEMAPRKTKKGQFGPFHLQDCRLNIGIIF